jgi:ketosteroid isomerase-like protein
MSRGPAAVGRRFVDAVNRHDLDALASLLAPAHLFVDSLGRRLSGREPVLAAWRGYFELVPDYALEIRREMAAGAELAYFGTASGSLAVRGALVPESAWSTPFAARARIEGDRLLEWQVYADNEPLRILVRRWSTA